MPSRKKEIAQEIVRAKSISIQTACKIFRISETCYRYKSKLNNENILRG